MKKNSVEGQGEVVPEEFGKSGSLDLQFSQMGETIGKSVDTPIDQLDKEEKVIRLFKDLVSLKGREIISFLIKDKDKDCLLIKLNWLSKIIEESILIHFTETLSDTPFAVLSKEIKNTLDIDTLIHLYDEILPMINSLQLNENLNYDFQTAAINY